MIKFCMKSPLFDFFLCMLCFICFIGAYDLAEDPDISTNTDTPCSTGNPIDSPLQSLPEVIVLSSEHDISLASLFFHHKLDDHDCALYFSGDSETEFDTDFSTADLIAVKEEVDSFTGYY